MRFVTTKCEDKVTLILLVIIIILYIRFNLNIKDNTINLVVATITSLLFLLACAIARSPAVCEFFKIMNTA